MSKEYTESLDKQIQTIQDKYKQECDYADFHNSLPGVGTYFPYQLKPRYPEELDLLLKLREAFNSPDTSFTPSSPDSNNL